MTNLRVCRGNSDFDIRHLINTNFIYELPFGRGQTFLKDSSGWVNQISWRLGSQRDRYCPYWPSVQHHHDSFPRWLQLQQSSRAEPEKYSCATGEYS
jgi:hypothetical protein